MAKRATSATVFMRRTYNIYRHQKLRAMEACANLTYSVDFLRSMAKEVIGKPCPYCGEPIEPKTFSFDHDTPVDRGGAHTHQNLVVLCLRCNQVKGNMTATEFGELLSTVLNLASEAARSILSRLRAGARFYK